MAPVEGLGYTIQPLAIRAAGFRAVALKLLRGRVAAAMRPVDSSNSGLATVSK